MAFFAVGALSIGNANAQNSEVKVKKAENTTTVSVNKETPSATTVKQEPVKQTKADTKAVKKDDCCANKDVKADKKNSDCCAKDVKADKKNSDCCADKQVKSDSKALKRDGKKVGKQEAAKTETKSQKVKPNSTRK